MDDHTMHHAPTDPAMSTGASFKTPRREYLKFAGVMLFVVAAATLHSALMSFEFLQFVRSFMGTFLVTFAFFKLLNLKMFAVGFASYDVVAAKVFAYAYLYPFLQLALGVLFLANVEYIGLDWFMLGLSLLSSIGVLKEMNRPVKCACLGNFVQLPLSTISLIEDFGMALLALVMIVAAL